MKMITLKMSEALVARLDEVARRSHLSRSDLIRQAVDGYLGKQKKRVRVSVLDLVRDLAGCCEGPSDLSTDPRHLEGFGR